MKAADLMINVQPVKPRTAGMCCVQGRKQKCGRYAAFLVFSDDGKPKMSRLDSRPCPEHLPQAIMYAKLANDKLAKLLRESEIVVARKFLDSVQGLSVDPE